MSTSWRARSRISKNAVQFAGLGGSPWLHPRMVLKNAISVGCSSMSLNVECPESRMTCDASGDRGMTPPPISMSTKYSATSSGTPSRLQDALRIGLLPESNALDMSQNVVYSGVLDSLESASRLVSCMIADSVLLPGRNPCCSPASASRSSHIR